MLHVSVPEAPEPDAVLASAADERLVRTARELTADLLKPSRPIYWLDLALTAVATWGGLWLVVQGGAFEVRAIAFVVCVFALYRGVSFIHELAHVRSDDLPGFRPAWNALIGVPFLAPSFFYEGVHVLHHAKDRYGTVRDPEYLPLARYSPARIAGFVAIALLAPVGVLIRFGIATPVSLLSPKLRKVVVARMSAMTINPAFVREDHDRAAGAPWLAQEIACWLWCWTILALTVTGVIPAAWPLAGLAVMAVMTFINQLRTVGAHTWTNGGEVMPFIDQFRDSVNVPPPALLPMLWAPVGLRYHALHHLIPRLPYHNLATAHRRVTAALPAQSVYHEVNHRNLAHALGRLLARARAHGRK